MPRLTVTRKEGERIVLHKDGDVLAVTTVVAARHASVRVGTYAPSSIQVHRLEVFERIYGKLQDDWHMEAAS